MRTTLLATILALLFSELAAPAAADAWLARDGKAQAGIFVSARVMAADEGGQRLNWKDMTAEGQRRRLRESVRDLDKYLSLMTGGQFDITPHAPERGDQRVAILIGELAQRRFGPPKKQATFKQGFRYVVSPGAVGLYGESDLAASYAIYELLDRLGCRWFMPSEQGEVVPQLPTIRLAETDVSSAPYTAYRGVWYCDDAFARRNRLGGLLINAGHALEGYITQEQRREHPEWVGTVDGKPQRRRLRWSAPGLPEAIGDAILARLEKTPDQLSVSLSPDDGLGYDNSPADRALDAGDFDPSFQGVSLTDRGVWFSNRIVKRVTEKRPEVLFGLLAYAACSRPPVREKLHPNIVPQLAPITYSRAHPMTDDGEPNNGAFRELVEGWAKAAPACRITTTAITWPNRRRRTHL